MKLKTPISTVSGIICFLLVISLFSQKSTAQTFADNAFRGDLYRWNIYPLDSIWQFYPERDLNQ